MSINKAWVFFGCVIPRDLQLDFGRAGAAYETFEEWCSTLLPSDERLVRVAEALGLPEEARAPRWTVVGDAG